MLILKFHPGMKCLHVFFSFSHPWMKFHPCLSSRDEISSRRKRVNSKRHFTIDKDDFIPGRVSYRDEISRVHPLRGCSYQVSWPGQVGWLTLVRFLSHVHMESSFSLQSKSLLCHWKKIVLITQFFSGFKFLSIFKNKQ